MKPDLRAIHEALGDEYLDTMRAFGVRGYPWVSWLTMLPSGGGGTVALIHWSPEEADEVAGFPLDMLACEVARRVMARLGSGN